ncbi:MAG TPA: bifunctional UDP-N-acetylglucosamine diphosphorylase/glucosamine-1-phosphate N-acetyltransferase GlmU [Candidatus Acidoferrales bacterium]|nr:bifunctional UDP-N-acetylglucosamine diphosphorylase/glucosamine-1-phosphate N-acetyltransferase GlmU [Candidatus Acidoferrales bacterium]
MSERSAARAVVLAAGRGTRMRSRMPKVWHSAGGLSLLEHALRAAEAASSGRPILVVAELDESVRTTLEQRAELVLQPEPKGTGAALARARRALAGEGQVLVLPGDMPLLTVASLRKLLQAVHDSRAGAAVLTAAVTDSSGYGRIVRSPDGTLSRIVEDADEPGDGAPAEVNLGAYAFALPGLWEALDRLTPDNAQGELYLSWLPQMVARGAVTVEASDPDEAIQVNDRVQLAQAEEALQRRTVRRLMLAGVTVIDPRATWIDCDVEVGQDTVIAPGTVIRGRSRIGTDCRIGPFAELENVEIGSGCRIGRSHLSGCKLADGVDVGPFNRVRPESTMGPRSHLGTFTEVVRSQVGEGSQIPHLSYVGDAEVGRDVNCGAGSITANWDGQMKHRTVIADGARLGSGTILVAPVGVGAGSYTGAGSVITGDVPDGSLAVSRSHQRNILGWVARRRAKGESGTEAGG